MRAYPYLLQKNSSGQKLIETETGKNLYDENWLQEVLRIQPDVLPVAEIEVIFHPMISIGFEVPTEAGTIDNLFISHRGYLTLVETKLWRNPQARREVVAQVLDYANSLSKWDFEKLNNATKEYVKKYEKKNLGLIELVETQLCPVEGDHEFFIETVEKNLRLGRFLALIVGDKIRETAFDVAAYINKYPGLALNIALIELQCFRLKKEQEWPLLLVPRIVKKTEIIERSIVQVNIVEGKPARIDITQEKVESEKEIGRRVSLTEEAFWEFFYKNSSPFFNTAKKLIEEFSNKPGIIIDPKESSLVAKYDIKDSGQFISLFYLYTNAHIGVWPRTLAAQISRAGFNPTIAEEFGEEIRGMFKLPKSRKEYYSPLKNINIQQFIQYVNKFLQTLIESTPEE